MIISIIKDILSLALSGSCVEAIELKSYSNALGHTVGFLSNGKAVGSEAKRSHWNKLISP